MAHNGKAAKAAVKVLLKSVVVLVVIFALAFVGRALGDLILAYLWKVLIALWVVFAAFTLYFFRDPEAAQPSDARAVVAPAHGKVDLIDEPTETEYMGGSCRRISIFLSVFDVHVQNAPVSGKIAYFRYSRGLFLNALRTDCGAHNENLLMGLEAANSERTKVGVRLIAGLLARRILPWVNAGDDVVRSQRLSLIQFGSRVDLYLPMQCELTVKLGDRVVGGQTVVATIPV